MSDLILGAAPWAVQWQMSGEHVGHNLRDASGVVVARVFNMDTAEAIALARNALDVMVRRGWTARRFGEGRWLVQDDSNTPLQQQHLVAGRLDWFEADNPFLALVKADEWYKADVDGKVHPL